MMARPDRRRVGQGRGPVAWSGRQPPQTAGRAGARGPGPGVGLARATAWTDSEITMIPSGGEGREVVPVARAS